MSGNVFFVRFSYKVCVFVLINEFVLMCLVVRFFKDSSVEERDHAEMLMEYQVLGQCVSCCFVHNP